MSELNKKNFRQKSSLTRGACVIVKIDESF